MEDYLGTMPWVGHENTYAYNGNEHFSLNNAKSDQPKLLKYKNWKFPLWLYCRDSRSISVVIGLIDQQMELCKKIGNLLYKNNVFVRFGLLLQIIEILSFLGTI